VNVRRTRDRSRAGSQGRVVTLVLCMALAACATTSETRDSGNNDPLEPMNRAVFDANDAIDTAFIKPVALVYRTIFPPFARDRIRAFIDNLQEPRIFVNDLLQLRINAAGYSFARFYVNSTLGLLGLFDVASDHDLPRQTGDFGETLYFWGVDSGPYLVLPLLGPSNLRDAFGAAVDLYTTPPAHLFAGSAGIWITVGTYVVSGIDLRSRNIETLDQIKGHALDYYAQFRSIATQHREAQLRAARGLTEQPEDLVDPGEPAR
jgi:phospholipid-binding lipoprotein MlaA